MGRHRKPDEFGDPNESTDLHPVIDVEEVDLDDLRRQFAEAKVSPPRHERFEPMYQGGIDPHHTEPITEVVAGGSGEQIPWPLVPRDEPLAAEREPETPYNMRRQHSLLVWAVTATIAAFGVTLALLYTLLVMRPDQPARCTHGTLTPTVTITAPAPPGDG